MAALPSDFWHGWIIVVTLASLAAMVWLVVSVYFSKEAAEHEKPKWDETLEEGPNSPPLWWFWLILGSTVFSLIYLMLYPGFGAYPGMLNWSHGSRAAASQAGYEATFDARRQQVATMSLIEIQNDSGLMEAAGRIYGRECAACHGADARGQVAMFPNLMDVDWQWGASPEAIEQSIRDGRRAVMPPWGPVLDEGQIRDVAAYVQSLSFATAAGADANPAAGAANPADVSGGNATAGAAVFAQNCVACHGSDATGNPLLGAPNLTDPIWLYGNDSASLIRTISEGRNGHMPAFAPRLDDTQIHLLTALFAR